jgi:hypothetical protein
VENAFQTAARQRWPGYEISGTGALAVVRHCSHTIVLVQTPIEAHAISGERCGPQCSFRIAPEGGWHEVRTIDMAKQQHTPVFVSRIWETD